MIDLVSTGIFALVAGMTLVQWLLPALPVSTADAATVSTAKAIVGSSIAALVVSFAYLSVRILSEFTNWLGHHMPRLNTRQH